ncbi:MAG: hypothetical protein WDM90_06975 [Ferruginibacter sp.]
MRRINFLMELAQLMRYELPLALARGLGYCTIGFSQNITLKALKIWLKPKTFFLIPPAKAGGN